MNITEDTNKINQVKNSFVQSSIKAKEQAKFDSVLAQATEADRSALSALELIDQSSGGQLPRLYNLYVAIKQRTKEDIKIIS